MVERDVPSRRGSPKLDRDEWILLLEHWSTHGVDDNEALSARLRERRPGLDPAWRSADGLRKEMLTFEFLRDGRPTTRPPAKLALEVWSQYGGDVAGLAQAARDVSERGTPSLPRATTNPPWTRDETMLALDVYLRTRPTYVSDRTSDVISLSRLLSAAARVSRIDRADSYRNPFGVARKVNKFRASEAGERPISVRGADLEAVVWAEWAHRSDDLAIEVQRIRNAFGEGIRLADFMGIEPSRGPEPSIGTFKTERRDGEAFLYVMVLEGAEGELIAGLGAGEVLVKVGRSRSPERRLSEMNAGFPPGLVVQWHLHATRGFEDVWSASKAERRLLKALYNECATIGREFAKVPRTAVSDLLFR